MSQVMSDYFDMLIGLADRLPTGRVDARALEKLGRERAELADMLAAGDELGALLEAADVAYYAAKAVYNKLLTAAAAEEIVSDVAAAVGESAENVLRAAVAKYEERARPGNPKDDASEREAVLSALPHWRGREGSIREPQNPSGGAVSPLPHRPTAARRGGKRPGAGRKPVYGERMVWASVYMPKALAEKAAELGGGNRSAGIRKALEMAEMS